MKEDYFSNDEYWKEYINKELELICGIGQYSKRFMEYGYEVISTCS